MTDRSKPKAFTLIELLVVMTIIMSLAALLLVAITGARRYVTKAKTSGDISNMMTALTQYYNDFAAYPPGPVDTAKDAGASLDDSSCGAGAIPADPNKPLATELQLRTIGAKLTIEGGNRTVGPYYSPNPNQVDRNGHLIDAWGKSYRYFPDGRNTVIDPSTGMRKPSRVERGPVIWSLGPDTKQDPLNDNVDNDNDGHVDNGAELVDDICSWN